VAQLQVRTFLSDFQSEATVFTSARSKSSLKLSELGERIMEDVKAPSSRPDRDIWEEDSSKPDSESLLPWLRPTC
jgi:GH15 family glucan-1,4-alpha-glucosidase